MKKSWIIFFSASVGGDLNNESPELTILGTKRARLLIFNQFNVTSVTIRIGQKSAKKLEQVAKKCCQRVFEVNKVLLTSFKVLGHQFRPQLVAKNDKITKISDKI